MMKLKLIFNDIYFILLLYFVDGVEREERLDLDKYNLNDEENEIVNNVKKLSDKDINDLESIELIELNNIIRRDEENNNLTEEKRQIIEEILSVELTEEENNRAKKIELTEDEEKIATQKLKSDEKELTSEKKQQRLEELRILKIKFRKYLLQEKQTNAAYKIKKMKKQKEDLVKNYETLLKKIAKTFDALYLCHSKQEFINMMKEKKIEISDNIPMRKSQTKRPTKKLTKKVKRRSSVNRRYIKTDNLIAPPENKDEEDDKSNYDPDLKILNKFLKEQNKEKEKISKSFIKVWEDFYINYMTMFNILEPEYKRYKENKKKRLEKEMQAKKFAKNIDSEPLLDAQFSEGNIDPQSSNSVKNKFLEQFNLELKKVDYFYSQNLNKVIRPKIKEIKDQIRHANLINEFKMNADTFEIAIKETYKDIHLTKRFIEKRRI